MGLGGKPSALSFLAKWIAYTIGIIVHNFSHYCHVLGWRVEQIERSLVLSFFFWITHYPSMNFREDGGRKRGSVMVARHFRPGASLGTAKRLFI